MWINAREEAPKKENEHYLVALDSGMIMSVEYCEGWNCHREYTGEISRQYEMHNVAAWQELPKLPSWMEVR